MKVLCISPVYWPAFKHGGPAISVHTLNKGLVRKGIDVTVYTTNSGLQNEVSLNSEVEIDGVKVTYFKFKKFIEYLSRMRWHFSPEMAKAIERNLHTFDLVHIHAIWNYPVAVAANLCRRHKKPYILTPRGTLYPYALNRAFFKKWIYYQLIMKKIIGNAAAIHYTTEDEAERTHVALKLSNRLFVVPNAVEMPCYEDVPSEEKLQAHYPLLRDKKVILFLGRVNWKKGLDILVGAYAKLAGERDDTCLLIVGNDTDKYSKKIKRLIVGQGIGYVDYSTKRVFASDKKADVIFTGILTGREKEKAYRGSDIFILPSYSENFGVAVIEAMACGVPVVISDKVGIYKEVKKNEAGIIVRCEAESIYNGIKTVLDNKEVAKRLSVNGQKLAKDFCNIDKIADMMVKEYAEIIYPKQR